MGVRKFDTKVQYLRCKVLLTGAKMFVNDVPLRLIQTTLHILISPTY